MKYDGELIQLTVSIGIAVVPAHDKVSFDQLRHLAAAALNEAKAQGRNCCVVRVLPKSLNYLLRRLSSEPYITFSSLRLAGSPHRDRPASARLQFRPRSVPRSCRPRIPTRRR